MKNVTIKDVAKFIGVSPSTVSRVISNDSRISTDTQKKVKAAMDKLGYHPNKIARSLVKQETNTIGLILSRSTQDAFANPFFPGIIQGIASIAQQEDFSLLLAAAQSYEEEKDGVLRMLREKRADGVILMASRVKDNIIKILLTEEFPFVLIGRSMEYKDIPLVDGDNVQSAYNAVNYLIGKGYKKIGFLNGPEDYVMSRDRLRGYKKALKEHHIEYIPELIKYTDFNYSSSYNKAIDLLEKNIVDAVFTIDDMVALSVLRATKELNFKVPEDIGIIGFNDYPTVAYMNPSLTTVHAPVKDMGKKAADMLIKIIKNKNYSGEKIIVPTKIIARESTGD